MSCLYALLAVACSDLDSPSGQRVASDNYDPTGFFGLVFTARF
ncbi:MAG: hypothetical protein ACYSUF_01110 [Planctomycetota bacterium]